MAEPVGPQSVNLTLVEDLRAKYQENLPPAPPETKKKKVPGAEAKRTRDATVAAVVDELALGNSYKDCEAALRAFIETLPIGKPSDKDLEALAIESKPELLPDLRGRGEAAEMARAQLQALFVSNLIKDYMTYVYAEVRGRNGGRELRSKLVSLFGECCRRTILNDYPDYVIGVAEATVRGKDKGGVEIEVAVKTPTSKQVTQYRRTQECVVRALRTAKPLPPPPTSALGINFRFHADAP